MDISPPNTNDSHNTNEGELIDMLVELRDDLSNEENSLRELHSRLTTINQCCPLR
jgi:hypothetical protein